MPKKEVNIKKDKKAKNDKSAEPTLEELKNEEMDAEDNSKDTEEEIIEVPETESLEARAETEKKRTDSDDSEGTFMTVDAAEERNVKPSDLSLDTNAMGIQTDEFICSICFLILNKAQLAKPRAKVCSDCS